MGSDAPSGDRGRRHCVCCSWEWAQPHSHPGLQACDGADRVGADHESVEVVIADGAGGAPGGVELVIAEWDRATRSMWDGLQIIKAVIDAGAAIKVLDRSYIDLATPMGRGFMAMMSAMAEDERLRIIKRTPRRTADCARQRRPHGPEAKTHAAPDQGGAAAPCPRRADAQPRQKLRCQCQHDFPAMTERSGPKKRPKNSPDGSEIMKRRAPRDLSLRPAKFEFDPKKAYTAEQLAEIGAITLKWNQIEAHIDFIGSHILFPKSPFWLQIATHKTLSTKAKLNLLKECLKHAEFFDDKSKRCIYGCFS